MEAEEGIQEAVVVSGYFPGDYTWIAPVLVVGMVQFCGRKMLPVRLVYDASAHHEISRSSDINRGGKYSFEFILNNNLEIYNIGSTSTLITGTRQKTLDITLGTILMNGLTKKVNWPNQIRH